MIIALHLSGWGTDTLKPLICIIHFTKSTIGLQIKDKQIFLKVHNDFLSTKQ